MELLKDYPKEFAKLFRLSFSFLSKINMKFSLKDESFMGHWKFLYIIPCFVLHYVTMGVTVVKLMAKGEVFDIAYLIPPFLVSTQAILKAIVLFPKTALLANVIKDLGDVGRSTRLNEVQIKTREALQKKVALCNNVTYWVSIIGSAQYLMTPLVETLVRRFVLLENCEMLLPIEASYPFNPTYSWFMYAVVYVFQTYCMFLCVFVYVGAELFMVVLCAILGLEFNLLCEDLKHVTPENKKSRRIIKDEEETVKQLKRKSIKDVVKHHQKLCVLSMQLDEAFNQMIFINVLFVGLTTCFFIYAAQFSRGPTYMINNYTAVMSGLLSTFIMCYYGESLTKASMRIGHVAYTNTLWYTGDKDYQETIHMIIMRSQKPCCLTSMKYATINLNMFTKVLSSTWSYISLMNTVYGDK